MFPALVNTLLAVPSLPSLLPLPALSHLSANLPIFATLLPATQPAWLDSGKMTTELGRTHFLANLATFGITGGLLSRQGAQGVAAWTRVVGIVFGSLGEGWGKWIEGVVEEDDIPSKPEEDLSDDPDSAGPSTGPLKLRRPSRMPLPKNIASKLALYASNAHLAFVTPVMMRSASPQSANVLSTFVLGLLPVWRGTSRWENTLDAMLSGLQGRNLIKWLFREGARGQWTSSDKSSWDTFASSEFLFADIVDILQIHTPLPSFFSVIYTVTSYFFPQTTSFSIRLRIR